MATIRIGTGIDDIIPGSKRENAMPAKSEAQRKLLNARFGHAWVKAHGFDNRGPLPARIGTKKKRKKLKFVTHHLKHH